ncbi:hypothetical protein Goklo_028954, partial [Gossypium klotzschianum]|nr:hypothetical protein [Gossypium klotzschianum]
NLDLFRAWVPEVIINRIVIIPPPHPNFGSDRIIWTQSASGVFSVRSAYWYLKENSWNPQEDYWKIVWKYRGPQRVRVFLWLAFNQKLLTNSERARRGIYHCSSCSICGHDIEDLVHVLRDCPSAQDVWRLVIPDQHISWTATEVVKVSCCWGRHYTYHTGDHFKSKQGSSLMINSADNWVFLFTDGAVARDSGYAATGRVAQDRDGNWIVGFNRFLGMCSPFEAKILSDMDLEDSGITVLRRTLRILHLEGEWRIKHIPRNQNLVADRLAKLSLS